jgi:hypothetical protein
MVFQVHGVRRIHHRVDDGELRIGELLGDLGKIFGHEVADGDHGVEPVLGELGEVVSVVRRGCRL